ncbi:hypothetical protein DFAR_630086 [Desulfarculales bacterium]
MTTQGAPSLIPMDRRTPHNLLILDDLGLKQLSREQSLDML